MMLTDPKAMRAMAHPVRMALLELLKVSGTLTATQASEVLGESPANCAFHLRTLAKYGFVEETGGGKGRERPWRTVPTAITLESGDLTDPKAKTAADALSRALEERWLQRARRGMRAADTMPPPWQGRAHSSQSLAFLTSEELTQVVREVYAVVERFRRLHGPDDRPEGTLPVEMLFFGYPLADLTDLADPTVPTEESDPPEGSDQA
jgi:DNA-binding transcriptional ArsR family regulator